MALRNYSFGQNEFITTGSGSGADAFKRLGYSADDLKTRLKEPDKLFDDIIGRLQQFDKAAQIRIADEVFGGTGGEQFVQMIERGQKGLRDAREEARRLGLVLSDDVAKQAQQINQEFDTLSTTIGTKVKGAVVTVTAALLQLKNSFDDSVLGDSAGGQVDTVFRLADRYREAQTRLEKARGALDTSRRNAGRTGNTFEASLVKEVKEAEAQIKSYSELIAKADFDLGGGAISVAGLDVKAIQRELGLIAPASPMIPKPSPHAKTTKPNSGGGSGSGSGSRIKADQANKVHEVILALELEAAQLGRTSDEQEIYNELAKAGVARESEQGQAIVAAVTGLQAKRQAMQEAANTAKSLQLQTEELTHNFEYLGQSGLDTLTSIVSGASSAEDAMKSLALQIANAAAQAALFGSGPMASFMSALTGSSGGALSGLFTSLAGSITGGGAAAATTSLGYLFDSGGYTGNKPASAVAGVVHGGEYVFSKKATDKIGVGNLEALHKRLKGYANGGYVENQFSTSLLGRIEPNRSFATTNAASANSGDTHHWHITTPDASSFQKSQGQIAATMSRMVARGQRNL